MEHLTATNIGLMLLGMILHVLMTLKTAIKEKTFSLGYWIKDNWIEIPISLVSSVALLMMADNALHILGLVPDNGGMYYQAWAFACGHAGRAIIFSLLEWIKPVKKA